ncbi:MAG: PASTA domain-containing protein, partial [Oscillospiraceae bacterium]|nr:PASTA domain-containing protein [Oscillospiraceae bacterium]
VLIAFAIVFAMTLGGAFAPQPSKTTSEPENVTSEVSAVNSIPDSADSPAPVSEEAIPAPETSDNTSSTSAAVNANISLPDFTNRSYESTVSRYEGTFTFIPSYEYSEEYSAGMMYDQSIPEGTMVSEGTQIEVKVSKGRSLVPLPDYADTNLPDYINKLNNLNIKYSVKNKKTNDVPDGYVAECSKDIGDLVNVEQGETIIVYAAHNFEESKPEISASEISAPERTLTEEASSLPGGRIPVE